jgi:predicted DNA-binding protein YlxM (UPF0122 family)
MTRKLDPVAVADLYREGLSLARIAERFEVSKEAVRQCLQRQKVPLRKRGGNQGPHSRHRL